MEAGVSRGFTGPKVLRFGRNEGLVEVGEDGQIRRVTARLREDYPAQDRGGKGQAIRKKVKKAFGVPTDSGGHYLAWRFFQNDELHNLFPQDTNFNSGAFEDLEQEWATWTKLGYEVEIEIIPSPGNARPGEITVNYSVIDVSTGQEQVVLVSARSFVNAKEQTYSGTTDGQALSAREADGTTSLKGNEVAHTVGPDGVVNKVVALLRYLNPRFSKSMQAVGRALAAQRGAPRDADGKLLGETFFGAAGLAALLPPGTVIDPAEYARLEQEWIAHIQNGKQVVVEVTRPSTPGEPVEVTFTVTDLVPPPNQQALPPELPTFEDQIDKGPFGWFDPPSEGPPPPTAPSTPDGPPPPTTGPSDNAPTPSTDEDAQPPVDTTEHTPPRPRRERFLPGWVMVSHQSGQLLANPGLLAVDLQSVVDEGNGVYLITTADGDRFRLIKRVGPLAPGVQQEYSIQQGRISTVEVVLSDRLLTGEVAPALARVIAEAAAWLNGAVDEPHVFRPDSTPDVDAVQRLADHGDRAELQQLALDERLAQQNGDDRRAAIQAEIRALALAMGVVDGQQDPELLRSLLSADESAVLDRILGRGQSLDDDRVSRFSYFVKAIASSGTSAVVIGIAAAIFTANPLAGLGIAAPSMVNALVGSLSERYLDARKTAARKPAEDADRDQREFDYPGLPALLDGTDPVRPPRVTPSRATGWSDYLVRYATPSLSTLAVAGALTLFGIPALSPALIIVASGLARSLAERLFDSKKLGFRLLRTDAAERLRLSDPALFTNQVVGELADLRLRLDRLRAALEVRSPGTAESSAVTPVRPANPGAPPLKVTLTAQVIDNLSAFARWITMRPEPGVDIDPTELSQHVSAQVELLLNAFGPAMAGGLLGAFGDKHFVNREEAADDARKAWARTSQEAAQVAALAEVVEPRIRKLRQLVEQLEKLTGSPPDLAARAAERGLPVVPQGPQGPRPNGQARWRAYAIQVAAAALGSAGGAITLDLIFDMPDLSVLLTVTGAAGSLIGTPVARYLFRRAEILAAARNEQFTAALAVDQRRLLEQRAVSRYLTEQLAVRARQVEEQLSAPVRDQSRYTDHVRAALRQAELEVVPSGRPESEYDFDARAERVQALARIDHLAAEFDRLQALGAGPELLADARARLDFAIGLFDAISNEDGSRVLFPALAAVDPALGQRVVGGPVAQVRAGVEQAIRRLIAEPSGKPLLLERLIALEQLERAATAVEHHALHGTDESLAILQERLAEAYAEASRLWQEAGIPGGLMLPALSIAPGLDQVGGSVDIPVQTLPPTAPDGVLEWNHTTENGARSLFPPGMAPDSAALSELERTLVSLIELGYLIEVRIERVAAGTDGYGFTVRITDPGSNGPAVTEAYGPASAAELATLLNPETTGRHHAEEAPGRHSDDFEAWLRGRRPGGPTES
ncbi:DNA/RNA non-specific endonuclease [Kribbella sp. NPDC058245]|uniref:DNA/RNA non-specific endonuclease n=1 Tax=Kribbella sp. NPDC058245 TaxID=3346399 RepID=UPI0036E6E153